MKKLFNSVKEFVVSDWQENPIRCILEILAWGLSIACALVMGLTIPTPNLHLLYPMWISSCAIYAWACWTRGSFGMLANYILLTTIDSLAFIRLLWNGG